MPLDFISQLVYDFRFKPPRKYEYLPDQTVDVSNTSFVKCPQLSWITHLPEGQEDCLNINIYVPSHVPYYMPVMVWIHGGSLTAGSNIYKEFGPQHFMDRNQIIVTINYRLGPFGFLSLGNEEVPGNTGLLDQRMAMEWVRDNIHYFQPHQGENFQVNTPIFICLAVQLREYSFTTKFTLIC